MLAGWFVDEVLQAYLGTSLTLMVSFVGSTVIFFVARRWLKEMRDG
jgi:hypothetical protein